MVGVCRGLSGLPSPVLFPASFPFVSRSSSFCLQWVLLSCRLQCVSCYKIREVELVTRAVGERSASPAGRACSPASVSPELKPCSRRTSTSPSWLWASLYIGPEAPEGGRMRDDRPFGNLTISLTEPWKNSRRLTAGPRRRRASCGCVCVCVSVCERVSGCEGVWVCITTVWVHGWMSVPVHACVSVCVCLCVCESVWEWVLLVMIFFGRKILKILGRLPCS